MAREIVVINGPSLNRLGLREPELYGTETLESVNERLRAWARAHDVELVFHQSNHEGDLIDYLHAATDTMGVILNPGGYTHTSVAIRDAVSSIPVPVIEVHLTNIHAREPFRQHSVIAGACRGIVAGFGAEGYRMAMEFLVGLDKP